MSPAPFANDSELTHTYGSIEQAVLIGEQLEIALELASVNNVAKARLALVAVDNLAELLLTRHARRVFASSEGSWMFRRRQFSSRERKSIIKRFEQRLDLAKVDTDAPHGRDVPAILSSSDVAIFKIAHRYRNGVYHEDHHNPTILAPLVVIYAHAVGRAFVLGYRPGDGQSISEDQANALARLGSASHGPDDFMPNIINYEFRAGAQEIVDHLLGSRTVELKAFRTQLIVDLHKRIGRSAEILLSLLRDGAPAERVQHAFLHAQFWLACGADAEWQRLDGQRRDLLDELLHLADQDPAGDPERTAAVEGDSDALRTQIADAERAYVARAHELRRDFKPLVALDDPPRLNRRADKLTSATDLPSLINRYRELDLLVETLERATADTASGWAHAIDRAVDAHRDA
jgi:hypothetical protein